ncbi:hypothetical protein [Desulfuromonas sp. DDH964]|uniref:hypothetical protein n=1 Tax=Desulfuromonas sp. DDH964 TaxID=1823759 RepID=UPI0008341D3C|nr:hypothetical protein [Desulfuromonas sp. DDH964]
MDSLIPDCENGTGCPVPELKPGNARILEIRSRIVRLHNIVDTGTICRICGVDEGDLDLLAIVEDELSQKDAGSLDNAEQDLG